MRPWLILVALGLTFWFGLWIGGPSVPAHGESGTAEVGAGTLWTCSMHPQIQQPDPGRCPICNMDLIPAEGGGTVADNRLVLSEAARRLAEVRTAPVERRFVDYELRLKGEVTYDETGVETLTSWVPGRIERLFVDYVGIRVEKGGHLAEIYSPEILVAERELQEASKAHRNAAASDGESRLTASALEILEATRDKLRLWGLSAQQIRDLEAGAKASERFLIDSPVGGVVIEKRVNAGEYVETGTPLFTIADLSQVWVVLEAYESDLPWLRYGQTALIEIPSLPGARISGTVAVIDPMLNPETRTVRVRVNVSNADLRLRPGVFVNAVVRSRIASNGRVMAAHLEGKWISPMHPEVVKDKPGKCDFCGMPLVPAEKLGYAAESAAQPSLVIPASAVLFTGKRSLVYVEIDGEASPTYEGREVVLGARAGDDYLVAEGLKEGERVVVNGAFKIDSALQIEARPSMMSEGGAPAAQGHDHQH